MGGKRDSGGADFDDLMAAMGVRPLDARGPAGKEKRPRKAPAKGQGSRKGKAQAKVRSSSKASPSGAVERGKAAAGRSPEGTTRPQPEATRASAASTPSKAALAAERALRRIGKAVPPGQAAALDPEASRASPEAAGPAVDLAAELETRTAERDSLRQRVEELQQALDQARAAALAAEAAVAPAAEGAAPADEARSQADALDEAAEELAPVPAPEGSLLALLSDCGILGADEAGRLLRVLGEAHLLPQLLQHLGPTNAEAAARVIRERVQLLGGCEACPADVPGRVVLQVPKQRCEVCLGGDARRLARGFVDGLLLLGLTRAALVGGSALEHQQLRRLVAHHRLELELVPPGRLDLVELSRRVDVLFLWRGSALAPAPAAASLPEGVQALVVEVAGRGLAALLAEAPEGLSEAVADR